MNKEEINEKISLLDRQFEVICENCSVDEMAEIKSTLAKCKNKISDILNDTRILSTKTVENFCDDFIEKINYKVNCDIKNSRKNQSTETMQDVADMSQVDEVEKLSKNLELAFEESSRIENARYNRKIEETIINTTQEYLSKLETFNSDNMFNACQDIRRIVLGNLSRELAEMHAVNSNNIEKQVSFKVDELINELSVSGKDMKDENKNFREELSDLTVSEEEVENSYNKDTNDIPQNEISIDEGRF